VTPPRPFVQQPHPLIVSSHEPGRRGEAGHGPAILSGQVEGPRTGVGHSCGLDRLLIEGRAWLADRPAGRRGEAEVTVPGLDGDQPLEELQTLPDQGRVAERRARRESCLREPGVVVGETRLRPRPARRRRHFAQPARCTLEQDQRLSMAGVGCENLARGKDSRSVCARRGARELGAARKAPECRAAEVGSASVSRRGPEAPQRASDRVVRADLVQPGLSTRARAPVVEAAVRKLCLQEKDEANRFEPS